MSASFFLSKNVGPNHSIVLCKSKKFFDQKPGSNRLHECPARCFTPLDCQFRSLVLQGVDVGWDFYQQMSLLQYFGCIVSHLLVSFANLICICNAFLANH